MRQKFSARYALAACLLSTSSLSMASHSTSQGALLDINNLEGCCSYSDSLKLCFENGVSHELAILRAQEISNVVYHVNFDIPRNKAEYVKGHVLVSFDYHPVLANGEMQTSSGKSFLNPAHYLLLDFQGKSLAPSLLVNAKSIATQWQDEHLLIPRQLLVSGRNTVELDFTSDHTPLNRHDDYLYTLFVPDHARAAFPCFDQPDLKAQFTLQLELPEEWKAISTGRVVKDSLIKDKKRRVLTFSESRPLPTYLFSFSAGVFHEKTAIRDGRELTCLYRETDPDKVAQLDEVMDEVALSLRWMENYTGIKYPFEKYGFVMIPSYQFGGMEHPGAIQYNDRTVFLGKNPTLDDRLHRLELLAHETAHMWFGDMVTMRWFNDVWTKEVFANYMASKVAREQFPTVNHDLSFLKGYQIPALSTDRTEGTHPIQQPLENLNLAGLLYGNIIYDKSPVMMRKLEEQMGSETFQKGLQTYLHTYAYGNATWDGLIDILDKANPDAHLKQFSYVWVKQKGMPTITMEEKGDKLIFRQRDKYGRKIFWPQSFEIGAWNADDLKAQKEKPGCLHVQSVNMQDSILVLSKKELQKYWKIKPQLIWPNIDGKGYGQFVVNEKQIGGMLSSISIKKGKLEKNVPMWATLPEVNRLSVLMTLYENYWMNRVSEEKLFASMFQGLSMEKNPLVASVCSSYLSTIVRYMDKEKRKLHEKELFDLSRKHEIAAVRQLLLKRLYGSAISEEVIDSLYQMWKFQSESLLNERDYMSMSYHLAIMRPAQWKEIVNMELDRLTSDDRKNEYRFISRACNPDGVVQDMLFEELKHKENRRTEPWASSLLSLLNDENREPRNNKYVLPGLELLQEVQQTGDIFFPGYWVNALLGNHRSEEARVIVEDFIKAHPDYPQKLKNKLLEAAFVLTSGLHNQQITTDK